MGFARENQVRTGLRAGGGSQERTRLRNPGLFRAILEGNKLVFGRKSRRIAILARDRRAGDRF